MCMCVCVHACTHVFMCACVLMLSQSLPVYQVRLIALALYCLDSAQPLSCLGSLVVEHLPSKQYVVGSSPP